MKKVDDQIGYDLNEQDIDAVLRYMKLNDPENATPEGNTLFGDVEEKPSQVRYQQSSRDGS